jgi:hypothetical protein
MFLRWTKYIDKAGNTRLYASLFHSVRDGKIVRHKNKGSLHILGLHENHKHPLQTRRVLWARLDRALKKFRRLSKPNATTSNAPSPPKSANAPNEKQAPLGPWNGTGTPIKRPRRGRFVDEALDIFSQMQEIECTCKARWPAKGYDGCRGCKRWWSLQSGLFHSLVPPPKPWEFG